METFAQFEKVSFKNVLVFKDEVTIPLKNQGVISVIGVNKDTGGSNGAGKSTIFDIIRAIHLGKVADGTPDIQFLSNKGSSYINYVASYGNNKYDITKYRNDKVFKNNTIVLRNGKPIGAKKNAVALRKEISENYIKLSEAVFDNCVILRTDKAHTLLQGTPTDRIDFISNICQLNAYDELEEKLKQNLKEVTEKIDSLRETQALYADVSRSLSEAESKETLDATIKELEEKKNTLTEKVSSIYSKKNKASELSSKISNLVKESSLLDKYHYDGDSKSISKEIEEQSEIESKNRSKVIKLNESKGYYKQYKSLKDKISQLEAPDKDKEFYDERLSKAVKRNKEILPNLTKAKEAKQLKKFIEESKPYNTEKLQNELSELLSEKTRLDLLSKLVGHKYDKCPLCRQVLSKAMDIDKDKLEKDLEKVKEDINSVKDKIEYNKDLASKKARLTELGDLDYESLREEYKDNEDKISKYQKALSLKEKEESYKEDLKEIKEKLKDVDVENIEDNIEKAKSKSESAKEKIQELRLIKEALKRVEGLEKELGISADKAEKELSKTLDLVANYEDAYQSKNSKLKKVLQKIGEVSSSLNNVDKLISKKKKYEEELEVLPKLEKKKKFLEALVYCYSNKGLKATKISKILEALSIRLQEYTSILFSEKDIEFEVTADNKSFSMMCIRKDSKGNVIAKYDAKRLSSGERARFTLALTFSLDDISSPNQRCNFKVLDEIDAKLDEKGKRVLLERFIPILKKKCDTLFIVSHDKEVRDSNIFDKKLIVTKQNAKSTIKLVEVSNVQNR